MVLGVAMQVEPRDYCGGPAFLIYRLTGQLRLFVDLSTQVAYRLARIGGPIVQPVVTL